MFYNSDVEKYKPKEFADLLHVTVRTLQKWDKAGKLTAFRTPTNRRFYTHDQYLEYMGNLNESVVKNQKKVVIYARVSLVSQKDDLKNQISFLRQFVNARGIILDEVISDIGSGLNFKRKNWNQLIKRVMKNEIKQIYIAHKDRFVRFGFDWLKNLCLENGTEIVVVNNEELSPEKELVQDLTSIIHVFSCRIYGLRKYKNKIKGDRSLC